MILIFGGAYQNKIGFTKDRFGFKQNEIYCCSTESEIEYDYPVIDRLHLFVLGMVERSADPIDYIMKHMDALKEKVIICDDISCGIVPLGKDMRLYRDQVGKIMQLLSREADEVYRIFCGLGDKIK